MACHSLTHHRLSLRYGVCGSMPVSLHYALFPVVVLVYWTPSAFPPYGSVLACAVPAVFYTPDRGASLDDIRSCRWPGSLVLLVSLSFCLSLPVCLRCSPDSMVPACIAPLRLVCNPGYHNGSDTLATLGSSAVGFCPSGVLCA